MDDEQIAKLSTIAHRRKVPAGQIIMSDQEPASFFANIISGTIKLTKTTADGRQQIVGIACFPPIFSAAPFAAAIPISPKPRAISKSASFPRMPSSDWRATIPNSSIAFSNVRSMNSMRRGSGCCCSGAKQPRRRWPNFLYLLARRSRMTHCADHAAASFELPLSRADIADYLGLTIETVSRQITRLKTSGVIRLVNNRLIEVPDLDALSRVAGQDAPYPH